MGLAYSSMIEDGSRIIVISEHWLWPFEMHRLKEVHPDFDGVGITGRRLHENSDAGRGVVVLGGLAQQSGCSSH